MTLCKNLVGACFSNVKAKHWKQGHSFKCVKRGCTTVRYWQPSPNLETELYDFCKLCPENPLEKKVLENEAK
jgi:hypothetical protein